MAGRVGGSMNGVFYATTYHPIQAGSIDGTDVTPHDNAVYRALLASSAGLYDATGDPKVEGDPYCTVFVGRLSSNTTEDSLKKAMSKYGRVKNLRLVRHIVTGASRGYAFVEYETEKDMLYAYEVAHHSVIDGSQILVDYNRQQLMHGWIPRRLGGGLGGKKESGQLRFGGRDRPFRAPLRHIPHDELRKLGIPLPPEGQYLTRFQIPPPPQGKLERTGEYEQRHGVEKSSHRSSVLHHISSGRGPDQMPESLRGSEAFRDSYKDGFEPPALKGGISEASHHRKEVRDTHPHLEDRHRRHGKGTRDTHDRDVGVQDRVRRHSHDHYVEDGISQRFLDRKHREEITDTRERPVADEPRDKRHREDLRDSHVLDLGDEDRHRKHHRRESKHHRREDDKKVSSKNRGQGHHDHGHSSREGLYSSEEKERHRKRSKLREREC